MKVVTVAPAHWTSRVMGLGCPAEHGGASEVPILTGEGARRSGEKGVASWGRVGKIPAGKDGGQPETGRCLWATGASRSIRIYFHSYDSLKNSSSSNEAVHE